MDHRSFASAEYTLRKKRARCEQFLAHMWRLVPWSRQTALIKPLAPHRWSGRSPVHRGVSHAHMLLAAVVRLGRRGDVTHAGALLHGLETVVFADAGYRGVGKQHAELMPTWRVAIATGMRSWIKSP